MKKVCGFILLLLALAAFCCGEVDALNDPAGKLGQVVKDYVISVNPDWRALDIRVEFKFADKTLAGLQKLSDRTKFKVVDVYRNFNPVGNVIFPISVLDGEREQKFFLRAKVEVFAPVIFARRMIKRGEVISVDALGREERDIALLPKGFFTDSSQLLGNESSTMIPENSTVFRWMIRAVPLVRKGDTVRLIVKGEGFTVKALGTALMDGYLAQPIKVKRQGAVGGQGVLEGTLVSSTEVMIDYVGTN
jgi:flagella basal body P-ring formation protein FlgA